MADVKLTPEVRSVLDRSTISGRSLKLPEQLDRKLYEAVNQVIALAGGKWNRGAQAHLFSGDPREKLGITLATGVAVDHKKRLQFFPTPEDLARVVVARADVGGKVVLEPSAGHGALALQCRQQHAQQVECIELDPDNATVLRRHGFATTCSDFLTLSPPTARFERIVMNPPFTGGQDLKHVAHAVRQWLAPGGRLVAIIGPNHDDDEVSEHVGENCSFTLEDIAAGAFKESGTNIQTRLLILDNGYSEPPERNRRFNPILSTRPGRQTGIAPAALQAHLESARNAATKGQAAFFTPLDWARVLALPLPQFRNTIVDLTCGNGQLLAGAAGPSTHHLLGCDIESVAEGAAHFNPVTADVTAFYPLLVELGWGADLFVLNPPWDLHWYRERLAALEQSDCAAVRAAFAAHDGRTARDTIDSTVATLCLALDRCSPFGEGLIIANNATLDRLIFNQDAPHAALAAHVWARLVIPGNICQPGPRTTDHGPKTFHTGVLYFSRGHTSGLRYHQLYGDNLEAIRQYGQHLFESRRDLCEGVTARPGLHAEDTVALWDGAAAEWRARNHDLRALDNPWNLWLDADGCLRTQLSVFDDRAGGIKKQEAAQLFALNGRRPMQLVLQKNDRRAIERAAFGNVWRVAPAVREAVTAALAEYEAVRAPLVPLNKVQRLGYLDDNDDILCVKNLGPFAAGERYPIEARTLAVKRSGEKMNLVGQLDAVEWEGSELAIHIGGHLFMDVRLMGGDVKLEGQDEDAPNPIEYTLQQLVEHFEIPDVPDVARVRPDEYQRNLDLLAEIEEIVNA